MHAMYKTIKSFIFKEMNRYDQQVIQKLNLASSTKPKNELIDQSHKQLTEIKAIKKNHSFSSHSDVPSKHSKS